MLWLRRAIYIKLNTVLNGLAESNVFLENKIIYTKWQSSQNMNHSIVLNIIQRKYQNKCEIPHITLSKSSF